MWLPTAVHALESRGGIEQIQRFLRREIGIYEHMSAAQFGVYRERRQLGHGWPTEDRSSTAGWAIQFLADARYGVKLGRGRAEGATTGGAFHWFSSLLVMMTPIGACPMQVPIQGARDVCSRGTTLLAQHVRISRLLWAWKPSIRTYLPLRAFFGRLLTDAFGGGSLVPGLHSPWLAEANLPRTSSDQRRR